MKKTAVVIVAAALCAAPARAAEDWGTCRLGKRIGWPVQAQECARRGGQFSHDPDVGACRIGPTMEWPVLRDDCRGEFDNDTSFMEAGQPRKDGR